MDLMGIERFQRPQKCQLGWTDLDQDHDVGIRGTQHLEDRRRIVDMIPRVERHDTQIVARASSRDATSERLGRHGRRSQGQCDGHAQDDRGRDGVGPGSV